MKMWFMLVRMITLLHAHAHAHVPSLGRRYNKLSGREMFSVNDYLDTSKTLRGGSGSGSECNGSLLVQHDDKNVHSSIVPSLIPNVTKRVMVLLLRSVNVCNVGSNATKCYM